MKPVKSTYPVAFQLNIFDSLLTQVIEEAWAHGKTTREHSSRTISRFLKSRGIQVSHMTVYRRMKSLTHEKH